MKETTCVKVDEDGLSIVARNEAGEITSTYYDLSGEQVNTEQKVLAWVIQLSQKTWMDLPLIHDFILGCHRLNPDLDIYTLP